MNHYSLDDYTRPVLETPEPGAKLLLHSCCAPCGGEILEAVTAAGIDTTVYFYNPNIHPAAEYEMRKDEDKRFCDKLGVPHIDGDYDTEHWFDRIKGLEDEPERGKRCTVCFDVRFERTAAYAAKHGFGVISSTLGISRWKNMEQINDCGVRAASRYDDVTYWTINWRKKGGSQRMIEIAKRESFYQQEYCGCVYSLRDTNRHRRSQGRPRVQKGVKFYGREAITGGDGRGEYPARDTESTD
ncbi:epoxyqueuosine reductase QueH [Salinisphaera sp. USBA-960]|uniref:epoxyqueuosine reductase QueH n=1 Tax=Salinisphaera orenii TaxID=856731 RepID=UPI000DBE560B|nr:epoxyqueuosine reductase QueH [Salifodinibacter halophilus]NNC25525.1 epoxyqueuosine reductase QueH [Salifodinibacter halophilus]